MTNKQERKSPWLTTTYTYTKCTVGNDGSVQYENVPEDDHDLAMVMKFGSMLHFNDGRYCIYHWGTHFDSKIPDQWDAMPFEPKSILELYYTYYTRHTHIRDTVEVHAEILDRFVDEKLHAEMLDRFVDEIISEEEE